MAPPVERVVITEPGVYGGIPAEDYHKDPVPGGSLSSTGLKVLAKPAGGAKFKAWREGPVRTSKAFNFGHAAHKEVLGEGAPMQVFPEHDARTKEGKVIRAEVNAAIAAGIIGVTEAELATVKGMAKALREHPFASALLDPESGKSEQAMFWLDHKTGLWCRSLVDRLREPAGGRLILVDYKTADSAEEEKFSKAAWNYGYPQQADHYSTGALELGLADDVPFVFIVQEKEPPFLVNVIQLDENAMRIGGYLNRKAIDLYAECVATDTWPGYHEDVSIVPLPPYIENQFSEEIA